MACGIFYTQTIGAEVNLLRDKAFCLEIEDDAEQKFSWHSLQEILNFDGEAQISHPNHYLSHPMRMLLQACLQYVFSVNRVDIDTWEDMVLASPEKRKKLNQTLFNNPLNDRPFEMSGDHPFLQIKDTVSTTEFESVDGLFAPITQRRNGVGKALRASSPINGVCQCCAAIGLYCHNTLTPATTQYWSTGNLRSAACYTLNVKNPATTLLLNVLHEQSVGQHEMHGFPWVPSKEGQFCLEKNLAPGHQIAHIAESVFQMTRSIELQESLDAGICDMCNKQAPLIRYFKLSSEKILYKMLSAECLESYKKINAGKDLTAPRLFNKLYSPYADHPNIAKVTKELKGGNGGRSDPFPQPVASSLGSLAGQKPAWVLLNDAIGGVHHEPPRVFTQYLASLRIQKKLRRSISIGIFGLQFESASNPTPVAWIDSLYSSSFLIQQHHGAASFSQAAEGMTRMVQGLINTLMRSAERLEWKSINDHGKYIAKPPSSKTNRAAIRKHIHKNPDINNCCKEIWDLALMHVMKIANNFEISQSNEELQKLKLEAGKDLQKKTRHLWRRFLEDQSKRSVMTVREFFLQAVADQYFMRRCGLIKSEYQNLPTSTRLNESIAFKNSKR